MMLSVTVPNYDFSEFFSQSLSLILPWGEYTFNAAQLIGWGLGMLLSLICYLFQSIALYSIAKQQQTKAAGLAWVPVLNIFLLGKVSDVISYTNGKRTHRRVTLLIFYLFLTALQFGIFTYLPAILEFFIEFLYYYNYYQPYLGTGAEMIGPAIEPLVLILTSSLLTLVVAILYYVFLMRAIYEIFKDRSPRNCALMILLCIFINYAIGPCLFALRKKPSMAVARLNWHRAQQAEAEATARAQREAMEAANAARAHIDADEQGYTAQQ